MPDTRAAVEWLLAWSETGPWTLGELDPDRKQKRLPATVITDRALLEPFIEQRNGRVNLYWCPHETVISISTTPRKEEITRLRCIFFDLDLPKTGPYAVPTSENFDRLLNKVRALTPAYSILVFSGGGYQGYWILPEDLDAAEHSDRLETVGQLLAHRLGSDAVQNVNRWLRLPGTVNLPDEKKRARGRLPSEAKVVEAFWDRTWDPFNDLPPTLPDDYAAWEDNPHDNNDSSLTDTTQANVGLVDLPPRWQKLVKSGDPEDYDGDRSRLVLAFCAMAVRKGWSDEQITRFLLNDRYKISAHVLEQSNPPSYAARQVSRARTFMAQDWDTLGSGKLDPSSPKNIRRALDELGIKLSYNVFRDRYYVNGVGPLRELDDATESEIRIKCYERYNFYPTHFVQTDVTVTEARAHPFHPVLDYLSSLTWDGVPRIDRWLIDLAGAEDSPYVRAVSRLMLLAAVRRIRQPGTKFDQMLVLISTDQGTGKSTAISALCPDPSWFTDSLPLRLSDQKAIEHLAGKWIVECSELQGMGIAEIESIKAFLSRTEDRARLAYGKHPVSYARRCVIFATTNAEAFLRDTQNRRFWPVIITRIDVAKLIEIRDQLWAEAAHEEANGASIQLDEELWAPAAEHQEMARYGDPWVDVLYPLLEDVTGRLPTADVWELLRIPPERRHEVGHGRLTRVMKELGWSRSYKKFKSNANQGLRCFVKGENQTELYVERDPLHPEAPPRILPVPTDMLSPQDTLIPTTAHNHEEPPF